MYCTAMTTGDYDESLHVGIGADVTIYMQAFADVTIYMWALVPSHMLTCHIRVPLCVLGVCCMYCTCMATCIVHERYMYAYKYVTSMVHISYKYVTSMVQVWYKYGTSMVHAWYM